MGYLVTRKRNSISQAIVEEKGFVENYQSVVKSWVPKESSLFIGSKCKELIDYMEKTTTNNLLPSNGNKAKFTSENGQSIIIESGGKKLYISFIKDLHTNEELKILLRNMRDESEIYDHSMIILLGDTNIAMPEKIDKFIENNKIQANILAK